ncbi:MAG: hypothetical protein JKY65_12370 [Planctomycetes bacterium]|nr:hypothetical protein [Planctomycetota bacterium]
MARSEESKKDLKFRAYVVVFLLILAAPVVVLGPGVPRQIKKYAADPLQPDAAKNMLTCIVIQNETMRGDAAKKNLEKWIELFVDEDAYDFSGVMEADGEWVIKKYDMKEGLQEEGFTPWLFPDGSKPDARVAASDDLVAEALDLYGIMLEDRKGNNYPIAAHIYVCLANMWPDDSVGQLAGEAGIKRCVIRSF